MSNSLDWNFRQVFGDVAPIEQVQETDMISCLKFNHDGSFLAAGDRGGRVIVFERHQAINAAGRPTIEYQFYSEFQAHVQGFDALRSVSVSERVIQLQWLPQTSKSLFLLTSNERSVKVWKIENKRVQRVASNNMSKYGNNKSKLDDANNLLLPKVVNVDEFQPICTQKKLFDNVTNYHINAVAISHDSDQFLISDDLKIAVWSLNNVNEAITVVDLKPPKLDEVSEVITYADYSPTNSAVFVFGTSHGGVCLADTRISAICDRVCRNFANPLQSTADLPYHIFGQVSQQADIAAGISSVHMAKQGNLIIARDLLSVRLWDIRMENRPLNIIPQHPFVKDFAQKLLDSEAIFDRNDVVFNNDCTMFATGSYTDRFNIFNAKNPQSITGYNIQATRQVRRRTRAIQTHLGQKASPSPSVGGLPIYEQGKVVYENLALDPTDIRKKIQFLDWSPAENVMAVATVSNLFIYSAQ
ncbi:Protein phosphatase PP2A regulatory subunit B [Spironucleus salmonicida]|uniref:Serine/threonine-protein phosphatase 2A 55 kDa regulatory subunit B n=1 Tax=Spironucleus salmonicida TaxID=348837 RepID=V6LSN7_9EUKA|nr:Protein phosphatase PP2A regulatory subunit B [Spironucleus salmonicida]|eukprot:EST47258.1 Protein phosphatase PP2A regulatory subunit B [Spironucleus salmonicida]